MYVPHRGREQDLRPRRAGLAEHPRPGIIAGLPPHPPPQQLECSAPRLTYMISSNHHRAPLMQVWLFRPSYRLED